MFAGWFSSWRLGPEGDDLKAAPFYIDTPQSPQFNQIFAAAYDLILCRCERMSLLAPTSPRNIKTIFNEKVHGTDTPLVSAETIAYLKWLIYVALFKDAAQRDKTEGTDWDHSKYYALELVTLKAEGNRQWRGQLRRELEKWYTAHPCKPVGKRRSSSGADLSQTQKLKGKKEFINDFVESDDDNAGAAGPSAAADPSGVVALTKAATDSDAAAARADAAAAAAAEGGGGGSGVGGA